MNNYKQPGEKVTFTAPAGGVVSGGGYFIGAQFVVAENTAAVGLEFEGLTKGVVELPKTSAQAWTEGQAIYWDPVTAKADSLGTIGTLIGVASAVAANPSATGMVKLNESAAGVGGVSVQTVAALGTVQADATQIGTGTGFVNATGADAAKGVKLPPAVAGKQVLIKNNGAAVLKVWPATGDAINAIAVDTNIALAANTTALFTALDATTWYTHPLLPS